jgi:hypothetical protein
MHLRPPPDLKPFIVGQTGEMEEGAMRPGGSQASAWNRRPRLRADDSSMAEALTRRDLRIDSGRSILDPRFLTG